MRLWPKKGQEGRIVVIPDPAHFDKSQLRDILQKLTETMGRPLTEGDVEQAYERKVKGLDKPKTLDGIFEQARHTGRWPQKPRGKWV